MNLKAIPEIRSLTEDLEIEFLDLTPCFKRASDGRDGSSFEDGDGLHPNIWGHEVAARCLAHHFDDAVGLRADRQDVEAAERAYYHPGEEE
jgi:lysophospholipase L1-like esterase